MFMTSPQGTVKLSGELTMTTGVYNDQDGYAYSTGVGTSSNTTGTWTIDSIAGITFDNFYEQGIYGYQSAFYITLNVALMQDAWTRISWTTAASGGSPYYVLSADAVFQTYTSPSGFSGWYYSRPNEQTPVTWGFDSTYTPAAYVITVT